MTDLSGRRLADFSASTADYEELNIVGSRTILIIYILVIRRPANERLVLSPPELRVRNLRNLSQFDAQSTIRF